MPDPFKTLLAIDFDRWAAATYVANFPDVPTLQRRVEDCISMLPDADVITGGFPCQPHSVAGERKASADERDGGEALLLAVEKVRPRQVLAENVAGLVTSEGGKYFTWFVGRLERAGYHIQWRLLDSVNYGVPQFRNRLWIWGIRLDVPAVHCWPAPTHAWPPPTEGLFGGHGLLPGITVGQALHIWYPGCGWEQDQPASAKKIRRICGSGVVRRDHELSDPSPTVMAPTGGKSGLTWADHQTIAECMGATISGEVAIGPADMCMPIPAYNHGTADPSQPCPTIKAGGNVDASGHQGGACPPAIPVHSHHAVYGGGSNPRHSGDARTERDITREPCTTLGCDAGNAIPYHWSDAMLAKHPPASPASPASTVQAKFYKGGAEGLLSVDGRTWENRHAPASPASPAPTVRARSPRDGGRCVENVIAISICAAYNSKELVSAQKRVTDGHATENDAREILSLLQQTISEEAFFKWATSRSNAIYAAEILQHAMLRSSLDEGSPPERISKAERKIAGAKENSGGEMRAMPKTKRKGRASPGRKHEQQSAVESGASLPLMPQQDSPPSKKMSALWETSEGLGILRNALSAIQEMGRSDDGERQSICASEEGGPVSADSLLQDCGVRKEVPRSRVLQPSRNAGAQGERLLVRRLTTWEVARLMSMPDDFRWPEKITKTAKYKIIGNGQCSLMVHHLARALQQADPQSHTVISLFCGGGVGDCGLRGKYWSYETAEPQSGICLTPGPSGRKEDVR